MIYSDDTAMMSRPTYTAADRYPWIGAALATVTLIAMALLLTFLLAGIMQWRNDVRSQSAVTAAERMSRDLHDPAIARTIQVGWLR